jgi:anti-sigma regulatory factor (Ser/Thr protein kinase)
LTKTVADILHDFCLPNDLSEVPPLRERFAQACVAAGVAEDDMQAAMLAFTELVNNAIEHGCKKPGDVVKGFFSISPNQIEMTVTDPGEHLTAEDFQQSDASEFSETGRGAGLFLIRALSDEIDVTPALEGGTTVRIVKHRTLGAA